MRNARRVYLNYRVWAISRNLKRANSVHGKLILDYYYQELLDLDYPKLEGVNNA